jgi:head-tail adaptor
VPIESRLTQTLVIERAAEGAENERGMAALTWATLATVKGLIYPKTAREVPQANQGGARIVTHRIYLLPTDLTAADRIRLEPDDGDRYQLTGVRNAGNRGHHLECDAYLVTEGGA